MGRFSRQTLATYAFFEDARRANKHPEDALIPFVLPSIAGRAGDLFSPENLAKELIPVFGSEIVLHLAEAIVEPLEREGYLTRQVEGPDGGLYTYTDKTLTIPLTPSISRAENDIKEVVHALKDYISASSSIKPVDDSDDDLARKFIDWITTIESPEALETLPRTPEPESDAEGDDGDADERNEKQLAIVFSAFVSWISRERPEIFEKVSTFAELGLVIDLVSEIRGPTLLPQRPELTAVLDSTILLELLGMCGPSSQAAASRLMELCRTHGVTVITLAHLIDEVDEISYSVLNNPNTFHTGSVNEAVRKYPGTEEIVRRVKKNPDTAVRSAGVKIVPYTQLSDINSKKYFNDGAVSDFAEFLPYDRAKPLMAKRDAWSLAYVMRRRNGAYTSNIYESKCILVTRSHVFAAAAKRFLRQDIEGYPSYAVTPVIELRHFSTAFMLAFGSDAARKVIRAELVATCDRIVRVSPGLVYKIKDVLRKVQAFSDTQLDQIFSDPSIISEFAISTGNDPSVVNLQNSAALIEVIKVATVKEEELRHRATEAQMRAEMDSKVGAITAESAETQRVAQESAERAEERARLADEKARQLDEQLTKMSDEIASDIRQGARSLWNGIVLLALGVTALTVADIFVDVTGLQTRTQVFVAIPVALLAAYLTFTSFVPEVAPPALRAKLLARAARSRLRRLADEELRERVMRRLDESRS